MTITVFLSISSDVLFPGPAVTAERYALPALLPGGATDRRVHPDVECGVRSVVPSSQRDAATTPIRCLRMHPSIHQCCETYPLRRFPVAANILVTVLFSIVQGSQPIWKSGETWKKNFTFSSQGKIREFEKNASNQGI